MLAMRHAGVVRRLATAAVLALAAAATGCTASGTATGSHPVSASTHAATSAPSSRSPSTTASASSSSSPWPLVVPVPAAVSGQHQTSARPTAQDSVFQAEMTDLWAGVVSGRPDLELPAFFPLVAYEQVKAIIDPAADWQNRLVAEFRQDVVAAHDLLGDKARQAALVKVIVPAGEADWISPGVCSNSIGYWHVANARMAYRVDGRIMSFGISTLISWRGRWYVVHFGGELRTSSGGMVDQPSVGPGVPGPQGGC
jgi:hypothetical protein